MIARHPHTRACLAILHLERVIGGALTVAGNLGHHVLRRPHDPLVDEFAPAQLGKLAHIAQSLRLERECHRQIGACLLPVDHKEVVVVHVGFNGLLACVLKDVLDRHLGLAAD